MLEDVERIEVISGPGAHAVGRERGERRHQRHHARARATRRARWPALGGGNRETRRRRRATAASCGDGGHYRVYAKALRAASNTELANGAAVRDGGADASRPASAPTGAARRDSFTLQGDAYRRASSRTRSAVRAPIEVSGANLLAPLDAAARRRRARCACRPTSTAPSATTRARSRTSCDTFDLELQHGFAARRAPAAVGRRLPRSRTTTIADSSASSGLPAPSRETCDWANVFVQDEIALRDDLDLTLGVKVERNDYTGIEFLPSVRLAWQPVARAARLGRAVARGARALAHRPRIRSSSRRVPAVPHRRRAEFRLRGRQRARARLPRAADAHADLFGHRLPPRLRPAAQRARRLAGRWFRTRSRAAPAARGLGHLAGDAAWRAERRRLARCARSSGCRPAAPTRRADAPLGNDPELQWAALLAQRHAGDQEFDVAVRHVGALPAPAGAGVHRGGRCASAGACGAASSSRSPCRTWPTGRTPSSAPRAARSEIERSVLGRRVKWSHLASVASAARRCSLALLALAALAQVDRERAASRRPSSTSSATSSSGRRRPSRGPDERVRDRRDRRRRRGRRAGAGGRRPHRPASGRSRCAGCAAASRSAGVHVLFVGAPRPRACRELRGGSAGPAGAGGHRIATTRSRAAA